MATRSWSADGYGSEDLTALAAAVLEAAGVPASDAAKVASALVEADLEGVSSHGLIMLPLYVKRILAGSVSPIDRSEIVSESAAVVVLDGGHSLGHVVGDRAMGVAVAKAREFGVGLCAVRAGFHFGTARRYANAAAVAGCIGLAMCNTRPLMPAPGGAERLVGTNPLAIALPAKRSAPLSLDISFAEAAMGRIRSAAQAGMSIPPTWATGTDGNRTTDPEEALKGMLLPAAGHKGFGMALMIDLLSALLAGGAWGDAVTPLFGDPSVPYDCSQLFIAIDVAHARLLDEFSQEAGRAAERVGASKRAPGTERIYAPGEPEWERRQQAGGVVHLDPAGVEALWTTAESVGVEPARWLDAHPAKTGEEAK